MGWLVGYVYSNRVVEIKICFKFLVDVKIFKWLILINILNININKYIEY